MIKNFIKFIIKKIIRPLIMHYLKKKNYIIIFRCGSAIGDHVYMSSIIKKIYDLKKKKNTIIHKLLRLLFK